MAIENKRGNRSCSVFVDLQLLGLAQGRTGGSYDATHTRWARQPVNRVNTGCNHINTICSNNVLGNNIQSLLRLLLM